MTRVCVASGKTRCTYSLLLLIKFKHVGMLRHYFYSPATSDNIASISFYLGEFTYANHVALPGPGKHSVFIPLQFVSISGWTHDLDKSNNNGLFSFTMVTGPSMDQSETFPGIFLIGGTRKHSHSSLILITWGYPFPSSWKGILYCQSPRWKKTDCNWRELCQCTEKSLGRKWSAPWKDLNSWLELVMGSTPPLPFLRFE